MNKEPVFAVSTRGLERVLAEEIAAFGVAAEPEEGGVSFTAERAGW